MPSIFHGRNAARVVEALSFSLANIEQQPRLTMSSQKEIVVAITLKVPCAFGNGLHPIALAIDEDGSPKQVRCGCDGLDPDVREVAEALAVEGDYDLVTCSTHIETIRTALADRDNSRMYPWQFSNNVEGWSALPALLKTALEGHVLESVLAKQVARGKSPPLTADMMRDATRARVFKKYNAILEHFVPGGVLAMEYQPATLDENGVVLDRAVYGVIVQDDRCTMIGTYHGAGIWKLGGTSSWTSAVNDCYAALPTSDPCPVCARGTNSRAHRGTARHNDFLAKRVFAALESIGARLHRT